MSKNDIAEIRRLQEESPIKHIAFIMDGNGRWAKKRGMPREFGHRRGAEVFEKIMEHCCRRGISAMTFYVFSTENWKRPKKEVDAIMDLLTKYLDKCVKQIEKNDVRLIFIGDRSVFDASVIEKMNKIEEISKDKPFTVNLAINYGGRGELTQAVNKLIGEGKTEVCEDDISRAIYTNGSPELDMMVRTGGDFRISNFLLWQVAYAELYFTDKLWPDLTEEDVDKVIDEFGGRHRRFGGV